VKSNALTASNPKDPRLLSDALFKGAW